MSYHHKFTHRSHVVKLATIDGQMIADIFPTDENGEINGPALTRVESNVKIDAADGARAWIETNLHPAFIYKRFDGRKQRYIEVEPTSLSPGAVVVQCSYVPSLNKYCVVPGASTYIVNKAGKLEQVEEKK